MRGLAEAILYSAWGLRAKKRKHAFRKFPEENMQARTVQRHTHEGNQRLEEAHEEDMQYVAVLFWSGGHTAASINPGGHAQKWEQA